MYHVNAYGLSSVKYINGTTWALYNRPSIMLKVPLKEHNQRTGGVASLDLMLGHTFYNTDHA